jgi:hypothetical protein
MDDFDGFDVQEAAAVGGDVDFDGFDVGEGAGVAAADVGEGTDADTVAELLQKYVDSGDLDPEVAGEIVERWDEWQFGGDALWEIDYDAPDDGDGYT